MKDNQHAYYIQILQKRKLNQDKLIIIDIEFILSFVVYNILIYKIIYK